MIGKQAQNLLFTSYTKCPSLFSDKREPVLFVTMTKILPNFNHHINAKNPLETNRLMLIPLVEEHLPLLDQSLFSDPDVMRYVYSREYALPRQRELIKDWEEFGFGFYTLFSKETGELVGRAGVFISNDPIPAIELGYSFAKQFWGKGFATEVSVRLLHFAFDTLGAEFVTASIKPANTGSINVAMKLGMTKILSYAPAYGGKNDVYRVTREEFYARKNLASSGIPPTHS